MLRIRIDEIHQSGFGQRIDGDQFSARAFLLLQRRHHSRRARSRILPDNHYQIRSFQIFEPNGSFAESGRFLQTDGRRFVTHIRAVGQIVRAELSGEKLVEKSRFI